MQAYFYAKIGHKLYRRIPAMTDDAPYPYCARSFYAEVLFVDGNDVLVNVTSGDSTLEGPAGSSRDRYYGDCRVNIVGLQGLEDFWERVLLQVAPDWAPLLELGLTH